MLFKKLVVPMCSNYTASNCSKLIFYKTDVKKINLTQNGKVLTILLNNDRKYEISTDSPRFMFEGIIVQSHIGTWYSIEHIIYNNKIYFLLEHEEYGDETSNIIIDLDGNVILDNVFNGFDDLDDYFDNLEKETKQKEEENTIHIVVQGGLIEAVYSSNRDLRVSIIDLDIHNSSLKLKLIDEINNLKEIKYDILE